MKIQLYHYSKKNRFLKISIIQIKNFPIFAFKNPNISKCFFYLSFIHSIEKLSFYDWLKKLPKTYSKYETIKKFLTCLYFSSLKSLFKNFWVFFL